MKYLKLKVNEIQQKEVMEFFNKKGEQFSTVLKKHLRKIGALKS